MHRTVKKQLMNGIGRQRGNCWNTRYQKENTCFSKHFRKACVTQCQRTLLRRHLGNVQLRKFQNMDIFKLFPNVSKQVAACLQGASPFLRATLVFRNRKRTNEEELTWAGRCTETTCKKGSTTCEDPAASQIGSGAKTASSAVGTATWAPNSMASSGQPGTPPSKEEANRSLSKESERNIQALEETEKDRRGATHSRKLSRVTRSVLERLRGTPETQTLAKSYKKWLV